MESPSAEMTLRDYAGVVVRRKWIVVFAVVTSTLVALVLTSLQTPIYAASTEVLVQARGQDGLFQNRVDRVDVRSIETEIRVIEGQEVRERVRADLGLDSLPPSVSAAAVGDGDVISLTVRDANADNAATYANAYADAYIDVRREQAIGQLLSASSEVQEAIDQIRAELDAIPDDDPRRGPLVAQLASFSTTLDQLRVDAALRTGGAVVIENATVPDEPIEPTPTRTAALALVVGLLIGVGAAFILDYVDDKIRTEDDLERLTDHPVLAVVPVDRPPDHRPIAISEPGHTAVESFRGLRTNLQFLRLDATINVVQVTSSMAAEGKTTTAANLAVVLAQAGQHVAIVDADLRRPRLHEVFGVSQAPGLTELLLGLQPRDVVQYVDVGAAHRISVYSSGRVPATPSETLSSRRAWHLFQQMGQHYDYVIVDSAPVLPVSDSIALSGAVDGILLVAHAGRVTNGDVIESLDRLAQVRAPVVGLVLNQVTEPSIGSYVYGGYGGYAARGDVAQFEAVNHSAGTGSERPGDRADSSRGIGAVDALSADDASGFGLASVADVLSTDDDDSTPAVEQPAAWPSPRKSG